MALFAPALWHKRDVRARSARMSRPTAAFAAELLDSIQGLATLEGVRAEQGARRQSLEVEACDLFRRTMWVLGPNVLSRGIPDSCDRLRRRGGVWRYGALRVEGGVMALAGLLIILLLGVEVFRPMRELRSVLHQGMVGMSAAQGIYRHSRRCAGRSPMLPPARIWQRRWTASMAFESVRFRYPGSRRDRA